MQDSAFRARVQRTFNVFRTVFLPRIKITSKDMLEPSPMTLFESQDYFLNTVQDALENDVHDLKCLKARQLGISTAMLPLDIFWLYTNPGLQGALIADTGDNKETFRETITQILESLPRDWRVPIKSHNRNALVLANGSRLQYMSAGRGKNSSLGRSRALNFIHACVAPGTPVLVEDGQVKAIEDVRIGDVVLTHTGEQTIVIDAVGQPNTKGDLIKITPWLGQSLCFTGEHTIPTQRGILEAKDVRKDDWLIMPIREITEDVAEIVLPATPPRAQNGGTQGIGSGATVPLTEEFGFACGYYLAEGNINHQSRNGRPTGINFARHRSETEYGRRVISALSGLARHSRTFDRPDTLTTIEFFYGAPLAAWLEENFGGPWKKRVPDEVFGWGTDFCRGLLTGVLCGDGSKTPSFAGTRLNRNKEPTISRNGKLMGRPRSDATDPTKRYEINKVLLPSISASIVMQCRDIAASLGYGWGATTHKPAGERYGRNCKAQWSVCWTGQAGAQMRQLMGLPEIIQGDRNWGQRYRMEPGRLLIKIRNIETGIKCETIYDLSVLHEDHTFRTAFMAVGNTECSSWGDQKGLDSLRASLSQQHPNRLYIWESTALGQNLWYDMCQEAKEDPEQAFMFIGWWMKDTYRIKEGTEAFAKWWLQHPVLSEEEQETGNYVFSHYQHEITAEQWAWYRRESFSKSEESLKQEMPSTEVEAWITTGSNFFSGKRVTEDKEFVRKYALFKGFTIGYGTTFSSLSIAPAANAPECDLRVWEEPKRGAKYVLGMDVAYGLSETNDRTVISVWRAFADKLVQVAEYASSRPETGPATWVLAWLAGCYQDVLINLEVNGPGMQVFQELRNLKRQIENKSIRDIPRGLNSDRSLDTMRWYLYHRPDSMGAGYCYNFKTSWDNKLSMLNGMRDSYNTDLLLVRSVPLLDEMTTMKQEGDSIQASGRNKDDRVMAGGLAHYAWSEWIRQGMMSERRTYKAEMATQDQRERSSQVVDHIIPNFLAERKRERDAAAWARALGGDV